jgi:serine/threonine protein kinase
MQDHPVAIKQLRSVLRELDESAVEDFEREVQLLRRLRHRNIVFFYGAGIKDGVPFLVTGFVVLCLCLNC